MLRSIRKFQQVERKFASQSLRRNRFGVGIVVVGIIVGLELVVVVVFTRFGIVAGRVQLPGKEFQSDDGVDDDDKDDEQGYV